MCGKFIAMASWAEVAPLHQDRMRLIHRRPRAAEFVLSALTLSLPASLSRRYRMLGRSHDGVYMKIQTLLAALATLPLVSGRASVMDGETQPITVMTTPEAGATCTASNGRGQGTLVAPATVVIEKSGSVLSIQQQGRLERRHGLCLGTHLERQLGGSDASLRRTAQRRDRRFDRRRAALSRLLHDTNEARGPHRSASIKDHRAAVRHNGKKRSTDRPITLTKDAQ
jgi:hypothetical protein